MGWMDIYIVYSLTLYININTGYVELSLFRNRMWNFIATCCNFILFNATY